MRRPSDPAPRILVLSGYDAASHRRWRGQLEALCPEYDWHHLALPARFFRWRIRGNPLSWYHEPLLQQRWDLVIATSMVDLATLRGLHRHLAVTPCLLYMHENQFAYPVSSGQNASVDPLMVNLYSALTADALVFNSAWNRDSFLAGVAAFLDRLPDRVPGGLVEQLRDRARVLPVPIEDRLFCDRPALTNPDCPHLLWNHRWEYDKGPERLHRFLQVLRRRSIPFRLSVVGERFRQYPKAFDQMQSEFDDTIDRWGYLDNRASYDRLLSEADVVMSTALHDFQGLAMLEAMASGCVPLAPDRLAYREYVPESCRYPSHDQDPEREAEAAADQLVSLLANRPSACAPDAWRATRLAEHYRTLFEQLMATGWETG